jgi:hypothetical protein
MAGISARLCDPLLWGGKKPFSLRAFAGKLETAPDGIGLFSSALFRRLLVSSTSLHFAEKPVPLHLLLQDAQRLIDVVISDVYLQDCSFCYRFLALIAIE